MTYYGTIPGASDYFAERLHSSVWTESEVADRSKALKWATQIIDALNFKGDKAEASQELEFPRDTDTEVPSDIERACYEIAYALLDGRDPEMELESLAVTSQKYAAVAMAYNRDMQPMAHTVHGVPSLVAWQLICPYLRDANEIKLSRVS